MDWGSRQTSKEKRENNQHDVVLFELGHVLRCPFINSPPPNPKALMSKFDPAMQILATNCR